MSKEQELAYFRVKTEWTAEAENGALEKVKTEELVLACNYTDAEQLAYKICEDQDRQKFGDVKIEIIKTKIDDVFFSKILKQDGTLLNGCVCNYFEEDEESGVGLYAVKVMITIVNEKNGKASHSTRVYYTPATSTNNAGEVIHKYMAEGMEDFVVRDIKFDKACAIYWPTTVQQRKALNVGIG